MAILLSQQQPPLNLPPTGDGYSRGRSTAILDQTRWSFGPDGVDPAQLREWYRSLEPYENLAGNDDIAKRALYYVVEHKRQYDTVTGDLNVIWSKMWENYQGRSLAGFQGLPVPIVHVPELFKAVETIAPRLEEPFASSDPSFTVVGRDKLDKMRAIRIRALLQYQLSENNFEQQEAESDRVALLTGFCAWKVWHAVETKMQVFPNRRKEMVNGKPVWISNPEEREIISYMGPRMSLVDNPWFIIDTKLPDPQKGRFVGDTSNMHIDEIADFAARGVFVEGWKTLLKQRPQMPKGQADWMRATRSLTYPEDTLTSWRDPAGTPMVFPVTEMWCMFDLFGTGRARECVITVANDSVVLRVQENPFYDKHRPYAVWKACPQPFEFHSMGPLQHLLALGVELDGARQMTSRAVSLKGNPIIISDDQQDYFPKSLWEVPSGGVITANPDRTKPLQIEADIAGLRYYTEDIRRDISESSGVPRILESGPAEGGGTATEAERQIQEANRRLRAMIRAKGRCRAEILKQFHAINKQYMTQMHAFRVLGRDAAVLGDYSEIGPDELDTEVDFEFIGLRTQKSTGLEAAAIASFFQMATPLLQGNPQLAADINWKALLRYCLDATIGIQPGNEIVKVDEDVGLVVPAEIENMMLKEKQEVAVHPDDDDEHHLEAHAEVLTSKDLTEDVAKETLRHMMEHEAAMMMKKAQPPKMQQQGATPQTAAPALPGQGSAPVAEAVPSQSPQAQTPGPPNASRQRKPGRNMTPSQSEDIGLR